MVGDVPLIGVGISPLFETVDNVEVPVSRTEVTAAGYSVVELETCTLWPNMPEVMVIVLGACVDGEESLDVGLEVGKAN